jgi:hypothetical protein
MFDIHYIELFLTFVVHFGFPSPTSLLPCLSFYLFPSRSLTPFRSLLPTFSRHLSPIYNTHSITATKKPAVNNDKEDDTVDDLTMSPTDAEELLAGLEIPGWDSTVQADMISPNWQQKADAVTLIGEKIAVSLCVLCVVCVRMCVLFHLPFS